MKQQRIVLAIFLTYFVFAILLASMGTVILQVINNYKVSKSGAALLEMFKDYSIGLVAFLVASLLPRIGFKRAMLAALALVTGACIAMPLLPSFLTTKAMFLCVGVAFALVKVSVYSTIGLVTSDKQQHASMLSTLEGVYMIGGMSGAWVFAFFIDSSDPQSQSWLHVYWVLAAACALTFMLLWGTPFNREARPVQTTGMAADFSAMLRLFLRPLVCIFILFAFVYVLIEQSFQTWLPTFNHEVLKLPLAMSVQAASLYAAAIAIGRLGAGVVMRRFNWYPVVNVCIAGIAVLVVAILPITQDVVSNPAVNWSTAPIATYLFPLIGVFLAPLYPAINSVMLSSLPKHQHASMMGLLGLFSALGGTAGSVITGFVFGALNGQSAFYLSLVPLAIICVTLYFFKRSIEAVKARPVHSFARAAL